MLAEAQSTAEELLEIDALPELGFGLLAGDGLDEEVLLADESGPVAGPAQPFKTRVSNSIKSTAIRLL